MSAQYGDNTTAADRGIANLVGGFHLQVQGGAQVTYENLIPMSYLDGDEYYNHVDVWQYKIRGLAGQDLTQDYLGLTLGMWVKPDTGVLRVIMCD